MATKAEIIERLSQCGGLSYQGWVDLLDSVYFDGEVGNIYQPVTGNILPTPEGDVDKFSIVPGGTYTYEGQDPIIVPPNSIGIVNWDNENEVWSQGSVIDVPMPDVPTYEELDERYVEKDVLYNAVNEEATHIFTDVSDNIVSYIDKTGDYHSSDFPEGVSIVKGQIDDLKTKTLDFLEGEALYFLVDKDKNIVGYMDKDAKLFLVGMESSVQDEITAAKQGAVKSFPINSNVGANKYSNLTQSGINVIMKRLINGLDNFPVPLGILPQDFDWDIEQVKTLSAPKPAITDYQPIAMMNGTNFNPNSGVVHPNVTSFDFPVNGYKHWMVINGYPNEAWEITWLYGTNNDNLTGWELISNIPQPLSENPQLSPPYTSSHDSDSFITYNPLTGELVVVYRRSMRLTVEGVTKETTEYKAKVSTNGLNWSDDIQIVNPAFTDADVMLSAGIIFNPENNLFYMYDLDTRNPGLHVRYKTNPNLYNPEGWSAETPISMPSGIVPWHLDVKFAGKAIVLLVHENQLYSPGNDKLWFGASLDFNNFTWSETDILGGTTPLYKGGFVPTFPEQGKMKFKVLYTSDEQAADPYKWRLYITETNLINIL